MIFKLNQQEEQEFKEYIYNVVRDAVKSFNDSIVNNKPYLTRKEIAKYLGVAESTITYWATLGMPVSIIDGRKLYGKKSIVAWLNSHEVVASKK